VTITGGTVTAHGGSKGSGIGTGNLVNENNTGNAVINISCGTVTACGGDYGSGIGGGNYGAGDVTISGGTVVAQGGSQYAAGIGGGINGSGTVKISGGKITATGGSYAAGIGGGKAGEGAVTISGGTITATGNDNAAGIGGGTTKTGTTTITGGTIQASGKTAVDSPKDKSGNSLSQKEIRLDGVDANVLIDEGCFGKDVYTRAAEGKEYSVLSSIQTCRRASRWAACATSRWAMGRGNMPCRLRYR